MGIGVILAVFGLRQFYGEIVRQKNKYKNTGRDKFKLLAVFRGIMGSILGVSILLFFLAFLSWGLLEGYSWLTSTSYFGIDTIRLKGNNRLGKNEILNKAKLHPGQNALKISIGDIESNLMRLAWIKDVSVKRKLPDSFFIGINEKKPVFWTRKKDRIYYANRTGGIIAPVTAKDLVSLPLLYFDDRNKEVKNDLQKLTGQLQQKRLPFSTAKISWVNFVSQELVELFLRDFDILLKLGREEINANCRFLSRIWGDLTKRKELKRVKVVRIYNKKAWVGFEQLKVASN